MTRSPSRARRALRGCLLATLSLALVPTQDAMAQKIGLNCLADGGTNCTALIPDGAGSLASTVTVPSLCPTVSRACIALGVEHSEMSDVTVTLSHDATAVPLALATSPDGQLAQVLETAFDGQNGAGVWTLTLTDAVNGDYGALNNWALGLCCGADCGDGLVRVDPLGGLVTTESGDTDQFAVELTCPPFHEVTIGGIATTDATEGLHDLGSLVFTAANATLPQTITSTGVDDPLLDGDQPYQIVLGSTAVGAPFTVLAPADLYNPPSVYAGIDVADVALVNLDNETDLAIVKQLVQIGPPAIYTIVASNQGPGTVMGAHVVDVFSAGFACTWTCIGTNGGVCTAGPVAGNIDDLVTLPGGASVTYTATCAYAGMVNFGNTATIAPPQGVIDIDPADNSGTVVPAAEPAPAPALGTWGIALALLGLAGLARRRMKQMQS